MKNPLLASARLSIWRVVIAMLLISAVPALSATWTVTSKGDDPNDTTTLRGALAAATDGDTIDLTGVTGTIPLTYGTVPVERELAVNASVTITGPGAGKLAIDGNNFSRVFHVFGVTATISGLTIQNGNENGDTDLTSTGAGIRNSGTLTLSDCTVSGNSVTGNGGGIYNVGGKSLTITNCTISGNSAQNNGGGIFNDASGGVSVSNSTITGNTAGTGISGAGPGRGAGIYNKSLGTLIVSSSTISNNLAKGDPDKSNGAGGFGGGINNGGTATVTDTTLSDNEAQDGGATAGNGGGIFGDGTLTLATSTVSGNTEAGISIQSGIVNVTNSTFYGNKGAFGYAVSDSGGTVTITSSTLANNNLGVLGIEGSITLKNTILANSGANCGLGVDASITSQDHNISRDASCASFLVQPNDFSPGTDPGLDSSLKDNGGPTKTVALVPGSVAVDAITASGDCTVGTDQRGVTRPQGAYCDIGAYEAKPDFYFSPISAVNLGVGSSGTMTVQVNSFVGFNSAVTLTTPGAPLDFSTSFSPNPVTPASYGSANATLTVSLQPSVTAGTYSVTVTGTSGSLTHSTTVMVNVQPTIDGTITVIGTDQALGCIDNSGISGALQSKLNAAQADIAAGKIQEAINTLKALLNQLQAQAGKHISTSCKDGSGNTFNPDAVLIADVQGILASLGVTVSADPIIGNVLNSSGVGLSGFTVNVLNSKNATVMSAVTDVTGFYYFPATSTLVSGTNYSVKVSVPKGYRNSTPSSQSFTWRKASITLSNFVVN